MIIVNNSIVKMMHTIIHIIIINGIHIVRRPLQAIVPIVYLWEEPTWSSQDKPWVEDPAWWSGKRAMPLAPSEPWPGEPDQEPPSNIFNRRMALDNRRHIRYAICTHAKGFAPSRALISVCWPADLLALYIGLASF